MTYEEYISNACIFEDVAFFKRTSKLIKELVDAGFKDYYTLSNKIKSEILYTALKDLLKNNEDAVIDIILSDRLKNGCENDEYIDDLIFLEIEKLYKETFETIFDFYNEKLTEKRIWKK